MAEKVDDRSDFQEELVQQIRDLGQELINNADKYVPNLPYITDFEIVLNFGGIQERAVPSIEVRSKVFTETYRERWLANCNKGKTKVEMIKMEDVK